MHAKVVKSTNSSASLWYGLAGTYLVNHRMLRSNKFIATDICDLIHEKYQYGLRVAYLCFELFISTAYHL